MFTTHKHNATYLFIAMAAANILLFSFVVVRCFLLKREIFSKGSHFLKAENNFHYEENNL